MLSIGGSMGGCECQRSADEDVSIEVPKITDKDPNANRPLVYFPSRCQTEDITLNKFIEQALVVCAQGDYDGFRQLFGTSFTPPSKTDFERIWYNVVNVEVVSTHPGKQEPPEYYVHAVVRLREPDRRNRSQRDAVVAIFKEADEWRMAPPSKEFVRKVLMADSQPAG
jgi:hypothetical protein